MPHSGLGVFRICRNKIPEDKHRFTPNDALFLAIAGIWWEQTGNLPPASTLLTTASGPDVEPIHIAKLPCFGRMTGRRGSTSKNQRPNYCGRFLRARCRLKQRVRGAAKGIAGAATTFARLRVADYRERRTARPLAAETIIWLLKNSARGARNCLL
jgi:hypothetical protein